jgi:hypothetical protein
MDKSQIREGDYLLLEVNERQGLCLGQHAFLLVGLVGLGRAQALQVADLLEQFLAALGAELLFSEEVPTEVAAGQLSLCRKRVILLPHEHGEQALLAHEGGLLAQ